MTGADVGAGLARQIMTDFARTADPAILREGASQLQTLAASTTASVDRLNRQIDLAVVLGSLADATADEHLFAESSRWFVRTASDGELDTLTGSRCLSNWALSDLARARRLGRTDLVDGALERSTRALDAAPEPGDERCWALNARGAAHLRRYQLGAESEELDQAEADLRSALALLRAGDPDDPDLRDTLRSLAIVLSVRFVAGGVDRLAAHDEAVALLREAVKRTPEGTAERLQRSAVLGSALVEGATVGGRDTLDEGLRLLTEAHARTHGPEKDLITDDLAASLIAAFRATDDRALLDDAVRILTQPPDGAQLPPQAAARTARLGAVLTVRYGSFGETADLDRAIALLDDVWTADLLHGDDAIQLMSDIGGALFHRFELSGHEADLDRAIGLLGTAEAKLRTPTADVAGRVLSNLGTAHLAHYEIFGDRESLDAAVRRLDRLATVSPRSPERAGWLASRGTAYRSLFQARGHRVDIETAITSLRESVTLFRKQFRHSLAGREARTAISNLAEAIGQLASTYPPGDPEAVRLLAEAVSLSQDVVSAPAMTDAERALRSTNLGVLLMHLHDNAPTDEVRGQALEALQVAVELTPVEQPRRVIYLSNLASFYFSIDCSATAIRQAKHLLRIAARSENGGVLHRIWAAYTWAQLSASTSDLDEALDGFRTAIGLVPELAGRRLSRRDRETHLASLAELSRDAAACAFQRRGLGDAALALELLERGRGVLLQQALLGRDPGRVLQRLAPELATRLGEVDEELGQLERMPAAATPSPSREIAGAETADRRRHLVTERANVLEMIRAGGVPELADFGLPIAVDLLAQNLGEDTAIVINVSEYRSDALVITAESARAVPCSALTPTAIHERIRTLEAAFATLADLPEDATDVDLRGTDRDLREAFHSFARWLWDEMAEPALRTANIDGPYSDAQSAPRVWWIPTGELARFPVHAAGHHEAPSPEGTSVRTRAVSSYATSLTGLLETRRLLEAGQEFEHPPTEDGEPVTIVVAMPSTPALGPDADLPTAAEEAAIVLQRFPAAIPLIGDNARRADVLAGLRRASILHLACHATTEPADPDRGRILLYDGEVSVQDLLGLPAWPRGLAYLSACQTADVSGDLPDESIHLASAFQLLGFGHTVATGWPIPDELAITICRSFYDAIGEGLGDAAQADPAVALHLSIEAALANDPLDPFPWGFLHFGTPNN